jgi:hypothetical protein
MPDEKLKKDQIMFKEDPAIIKEYEDFFLKKLQRKNFSECYREMLAIGYREMKKLKN